VSAFGEDNLHISYGRTLLKLCSQCIV